MEWRHELFFIEMFQLYSWYNIPKYDKCKFKSNAALFHGFIFAVVVVAVVVVVVCVALVELLLDTN